MHWPTKDCGRCINGVIYYKALVLPLQHVIKSFNLKSEMFSFIQFPMGDPNRCLMVSYEGRLALVSFMGSGVELWKLEDAEKHKWIYKLFLLPPTYKNLGCLDFKDVTDAGEIIYTSRSFYESFYVVYFDPKKNSIRETKFRGIAGDYVWRPDLLGFDLVNKFCFTKSH